MPERVGETPVNRIHSDLGEDVGRPDSRDRHVTGRSTYQMDHFQFAAINLDSKCLAWYPFNFQRAAVELIISEICS